MFTIKRKNHLNIMKQSYYNISPYYIKFKKGGKNLTYESMLNKSQELERKIQEIQMKIEDFPEGKLICAANGKGYKWYLNTGGKTVYLPKKERTFARQLAHKKYLSFQLKNMIQEKKAIDGYLTHSDKNAFQKEQSFITSPRYKELLNPIFTPLSEELHDWAAKVYEKNEKYPEHLVHKAYSGGFVRSKSEALIDMFLFKNQIPFRYECNLQLGETFLFPDFTIRHPKTGEFYYWEHFGMMDNAAYSRNACSKLQIYISNGIIPSIQLITTFETKDRPLDPETIEKIVEHYFL